MMRNAYDHDRARRQRLMAAGLCIGCEGEAPPSKVRCEPCQEKHALAMNTARRRRLREARDIREAPPRCGECGAEVRGLACALCE